jgi:hypothetical protein
VAALLTDIGDSALRESAFVRFSGLPAGRLDRRPACHRCNLRRRPRINRASAGWPARNSDVCRFPLLVCRGTAPTACENEGPHHVRAAKPFASSQRTSQIAVSACGRTQQLHFHSEEKGKFVHDAIRCHMLKTAT